jgi:hypothetical protein
VRVAELTATAERLEPALITPVIQPLYQELGGRLARAWLAAIGPAIACCQDAPDGDGVIVHATLPSDAHAGAGHGLDITDLPEIGQAATIVHRGSMDNVLGLDPGPGPVDRCRRLPLHRVSQGVVPGLPAR